MVSLLVSNQAVHPGGAYPGFHVAWNDWEYYFSPPGGSTGPSQGYPPTFHQASLTIFRSPFILREGERHGEWKASYSLTHHIDAARSRTQTSPPIVQCTDHLSTVSRSIGKLSGKSDETF